MVLPNKKACLKGRPGDGGNTNYTWPTLNAGSSHLNHIWSQLWPKSSLNPEEHLYLQHATDGACILLDMFHIWWHRQGPGDGDYLGIDRSLGGGLLVWAERFIPTPITEAMGIVTGKSTFRADQRTLLCRGGSHGRNLR